MNLNLKSKNGSPFHGFADFPPPQGNDVYLGNLSSEVVRQNSTGIKTDDNSERQSVVKLKRNRSSPGELTSKRKVRHPVIGSYINVDTIDVKGVYLVHSKLNDEENDFHYKLSKKDKEVTLNLKRVNWVIFDRGEKIPLKSTV